MARQCPIDFDVDQLRRDVRDVYARVATAPEGDFHFHRGPAYAFEALGYDPEELALLPSESTASFAGVGNPLAMQDLETGAVVVDAGCGAGMDLLLAARRVGPAGRAIGVDMTPEMLSRTRASAQELGLMNVEAREGDLQSLPVDDASVDVVISNGVLNLAPDKEAAFGEISRVLKPGGRLQFADILVSEQLPDAVIADIDLWAG